MQDQRERQPSSWKFLHEEQKIGDALEHAEARGCFQDAGSQHRRTRHAVCLAAAEFD